MPPNQPITNFRALLTGIFAPVQIKKGALGNRAALMVSQQHRILVTGWRTQMYLGVNEVLVGARDLINGHDIFIVEGGEVEYLHLLFDRHEILNTSSLHSESYHPAHAITTSDRVTKAELLRLFPELGQASKQHAPDARQVARAFEGRLLAEPTHGLTAPPQQGQKGRMASKPKTHTRPAKRKSSTRRRAKTTRPRFQPLRWLGRWLRRMVVIALTMMLLWISAYAFINPPTTPYMLAEKTRLGGIDQQWVPLSEVSPHVPLAVVAAEDANFCLHWGFDMAAIRAAMADGASRGGSTISQQVVKNVFLWQGRSWPRKALEALITPVVELIWTKRRILEVYLNVVEFDEGVFGIEAAARRYYDTGPEMLTPRQAALLAALLPNPKQRSANQPSQAMAKRARLIEDGAATISADGRARCFQD